MSLSAALVRHSGWWLVAGIAVGLAFPDMAAAWRPALPWCIGGLLTVAMMRVPWRDLRMRLARPLVPVALCVWLLVLCPVLVWAFTRVVSLPAPLVVPLVLMAATPPLFSTPAMALLWGLDAPLALLMVVLATLIGPFTLVAVSSGMLGLDLGLDPLALMARLCGLVGGALLLASVVSRTAGPVRIERWRTRLDASVVVLLMVFAVAVMEGVVARFARDPAAVVVFTIAAFTANITLQVAGALATRVLGIRVALTVGYASGNRAVGLLIAVLPAGSAGDAVAFFALSQLPIYLLPAALAPLYRRLVGSSVPGARRRPA